MQKKLHHLRLHLFIAHLFIWLLTIWIFGSIFSKYKNTEKYKSIQKSILLKELTEFFLHPPPRSRKTMLFPQPISPLSYKDCRVPRFCVFRSEVRKPVKCFPAKSPPSKEKYALISTLISSFCFSLLFYYLSTYSPKPSFSFACF